MGGSARTLTLEELLVTHIKNGLNSSTTMLTLTTLTLLPPKSGIGKAKERIAIIIPTTSITYMALVKTVSFHLRLQDERGERTPSSFIIPELLKSLSDWFSISFLFKELPSTSTVKNKGSKWYVLFPSCLSTLNVVSCILLNMDSQKLSQEIPVVFTRSTK